MKKVAIIAGVGSLPREACFYFQKNNIPFFIVALFPDDNATHFLEFVPSTEIIKKPFYRLGLIFKELKARNTSHVLFIGKVDKQYLLKNLRYDWLAIKLLAKTVFKTDKQLMETLVNELENNGITTLSQAQVLEHLHLSAGFTQGEITSELKRDIELGMNIVDSLSTHEIGQTVVVKDGMVLALEAIEGTDECIRRGIELGKNNVVICKGAHNHHNSKYDIPTLGASTLQTIQKGEVAALAWKASHTFIAQQPLFLQLAQEKNISLIAL